MITAQNLIYSKAAAARILDIDKTEIKELENWHKVILVKIRNQKSQFISKRDFRQHFAEWRKSRSHGLKATPHLYDKQLFTVFNPYKHTRYQVLVAPQELVCECEDWANQKEILGKACCKHCYSVLNYLNYSSLKEYIEQSKKPMAV
ncbi:MAG TPA: hypothetical protein ACFCUY_12660 [Xenococcaceae cyanobacterium]